MGLRVRVPSVLRMRVREDHHSKTPDIVHQLARLHILRIFVERSLKPTANLLAETETRISARLLDALAEIVGKAHFQLLHSGPVVFLDKGPLTELCGPIQITEWPYHTKPVGSNGTKHNPTRPT